MPRKPSFNHPLRKIRTAAGWTQGKCAEMLGVSRDTIQSVENGRLPMSDELALRVRAQTGCLLTRRTDPDGKERYHVVAGSVESLGTYTREFFEKHRKGMQSWDSEDFQSHVKAVINCVNLLMRAAKRRGGGTALAIEHDLEQFLVKTYESYGLKTYLKALLRDDVLPLFDEEAFDLDLLVRTFPLAPLSTSYSFPPELWMKKRK